MSKVGDLPGATALADLASAVERGLVTAPFGTMQVGRHVPRAELASAMVLLERLAAAGLSGAALAAALRLAGEARRVGEDRPRPSLVWSDLDVAGSRDTLIVCRELFRAAQRTVTVSTYNLGHKAMEGEAKGNPVLLPLAERMSQLPSLRVRLFVNIRRQDHQHGALDHEVVAGFARWFRREIWPWDPVPEVYYDPRSLSGTTEESACLHAKCVAVDDARAFVTSANLTLAAHERNIEAGVLLDDPLFARALRTQFESLIERAYVRRVPGLATT